MGSWRPSGHSHEEVSDSIHTQCKFFSLIPILISNLEFRSFDEMGFLKKWAMNTVVVCIGSARREFSKSQFCFLTFPVVPEKQMSNLFLLSFCFPCFRMGWAKGKGKKGNLFGAFYALRGVLERQRQNRAKETEKKQGGGETYILSLWKISLSLLFRISCAEKCVPKKKALRVNGMR